MGDEQTRFVGVFKGTAKGYVPRDGLGYSWRFIGEGTWAVDQCGQLYQLCQETTPDRIVGWVWVLDKTRIVRDPGGDE